MSASVRVSLRLIERKAQTKNRLCQRAQSFLPEKDDKKAGNPKNPMSFQLCALNFELVQRTLALSFQLAPPVPCLPSFQLRAFSFQLAQGASAFPAPPALLNSCPVKLM